ncbi:hypothetical protein BJV82DRAFT_628250 [Fennellomyces sp. T-0311]|nr:hypothetical protein BJV82DRAFT_628250 [Fennellomyces sp. T-0311]
MDFDYYGSAYGFSASTAVLALAAMISAVVDGFRTKQYYGRYFFMFFAGTFSFIRVISYIAAVASDSTSQSEVLSGNLARSFFYNTFIPLLFCVFFETCRTIIVKVPPTTSDVPASTYYGRKLSSTYGAYVWTVVLFITNIAYCALIATNYRPTSSYYFSLSSVDNLYYLNTYGLWAYVLFGIGQLIYGSKELGPCMSSLVTYFVLVVVANIGDTVSSALSVDYSYPLTAIISFVLVDMIGLFGLLFALYASPRIWPPQPKTSATNQPYYGYYAPAPATGAPFVPPPPQIFSNSTGSSPQIQQQYPVVQIPQQQLQPGQYPIVQIPISHQQQGGQYPIVQVQATPQYPPGQYSSYQ